MFYIVFPDKNNQKTVQLSFRWKIHILLSPFEGLNKPILITGLYRGFSITSDLADVHIDPCAFGAYLFYFYHISRLIITCS